ncbi:MAG: phosphoribosylamine--glycine ligase [Bacteroidota bacterium]
MNVLIVGSGGREHALGWKIRQSPLLTHLFFAPGNPGTSELGINLAVDPENFSDIKREILENEIDMMIIGPEAPLVAGIRDFCEKDPDLQYVKIIGPGKAGAKLEGSKDFSKQFMGRYGIPTAGYASFRKETAEEGFRYLKSIRPPFVLKADGLAAGKGVLIIDQLEYAQDALWEMLVGKFGEASKTVVIEEFLKGTELSVFILTDGSSYILFPEAKDYKRIGIGDTGLNTGGMGAVSPVPFADAAFMEKVKTRIIEPTLEGLRTEKIEYTGFIFFGLINCDGDPFVIEYNARLGDPETEAIMLRTEGDLLELLNAAAEGRLSEKQMGISDHAAATIMLVSGGYPGDYEKGKIISGYDQAEDCSLFHSGTRLEFGKLKTNGGRVLAVSATGKDIHEALEKARSNAMKISYEGKYFRDDIGFDLS